MARARFRFAALRESVTFHAKPPLSLRFAQPSPSFEFSLSAALESATSGPVGPSVPTCVTALAFLAFGSSCPASVPWCRRGSAPTGTGAVGGACLGRFGTRLRCRLSSPSPSSRLPAAPPRQDGLDARHQASRLVGRHHAREQLLIEAALRRAIFLRLTFGRHLEADPAGRQNLEAAALQRQLL